MVLQIVVLEEDIDVTTDSVFRYCADEDIHVALGLVVRKYRRAAHMSQMILGTKFGTDGFAVRRLESGKRGLDPAEITAIESALFLDRGTLLRDTRQLLALDSLYAGINEMDDEFLDLA